MKLLYCKKCKDIVKLHYHPRTCECGAVGGNYTEDGLNAEYYGGIPIGFHNVSFVDALEMQSEEGWGIRFEAFVIPKKCPTMKRITRKSYEASRKTL